MIEQILQADRYLQVDQVEKARDVYRKVVELDPGNAIAVVGLARCALADGEDQQAYELASRALEIDPENDMARRMEARLSEILTTRGEVVERPASAALPSTHEMRPVVTETPEEPAKPPAAVATPEPATGSPTPEPAARSAPEPAVAPKPVPEAPPTSPPSGVPAPEPATPSAPMAPAPEASPTSTLSASTLSASTQARPRPPISPPAKAKEPAVRKSLFDRLMGR